MIEDTAAAGRSIDKHGEDNQSGTMIIGTECRVNWRDEVLDTGDVKTQQAT